MTKLRPTGTARRHAANDEHVRQRRNQILLRVAVGIVVTAAALWGVLRLTGASTSGGSGKSIPYDVGTPGPGQQAPQVSLRSTTGAFDLASFRGKQTVLLYFQEGLTCQPCWDQLKVIQKDQAKFRAVGVGQIASITTDPLNQITQKVSDEGITIPVASDPDLAASDRYHANQYGMMGSSRDGHTFVLIGKDGTILWRADYGGPPRFTMFVPDDQLLARLRTALARS